MVTAMASRIDRYIVAPARYWTGILRAAAANWLESQAFIYAAALAFFTVFSMAPVVILVVAVAGVFLGEMAARGEIFEQLSEVLGAEAAEVVQTAVINSQIDQSGLLPTLMGLAATVIGATTVFAQMQQSLNQIWDVAPKPSRSSIWRFLRARVLSLTTVLALGFVLLVSLLLSVGLRAIMEFAEQWLPVPGWMMIGLDVSLSLAVVTGLFAAMFKILPDVVLSWRDVLAGAFVTAVLFTLGRSLIAVYLAQGATASAYGAAGSLVLLLLWVNYSSLILLFGAALTRAHCEARGIALRPTSTAVHVRRQLLESS